MRIHSQPALDRLVLAAAGVPRDYIGLVSEAIAVAKTRGPYAKVGSDRVIAENVNAAAGRTVEATFSDTAEDVGSDSARLRGLVIKLTDHCRDTGTACFPVDASNETLIKDMARLQNIRFIDSIGSNETVPNQQSTRCHVYVLNVSQLAAQRAWLVDSWDGRPARSVEPESSPTPRCRAPR